MNSLKGKQRIYWLAGLTALVLGVLAAALLMIGSKNPEPGPHVDVPAMQNVPPSDRKLGVEVEQAP